MKNIAVISEFNPFHNGHEYLFKILNKQYGASNIIAIMSGNFVQRGEPAMFDKYLRAKAALKAGASLVVEIPAVFACSSADEFAACGVSIANTLNVIDYLCFGIECGSYDKQTVENHLISLSELISDINNDSEFSKSVRQQIKSGSAYPVAISNSLNHISSDEGELKIYKDIISMPNNILALSYLKALRNTDIKPIMIKRAGDGYRDISHSDAHYSSATAIRYSYDKSKEDFISDIKTYTPEFMYDDYISNVDKTVTPDKMSDILNYKLLTISEEELLSILDVSSEIAGRILKSKELSLSYTDRIKSIKTKQYTYTRISRVLLHIILGITKEEFANLKNNGYVSYLRILGLRKDKSELLSAIKKSAKVPIVSKASDNKDLIDRDTKFDNIYYMINGDNTEYEHSPIVI